MNGRQRILAAIAHEKPDRVPTIVNLAPPVAARLNKMLGDAYETEPFSSLNTLIAGRASFNELLIALGNDCIGVAPAALAGRTRTTDDGIYFDEWQIGYCTVKGYLEAVHRPLEHVETEEEIDAFFIPDPAIPERWTQARKLIGRYGREYAVMGCLGQTLFEMSWNLVGFEKFLMDFCTEEPYVLRLFDRLTEYAVRYADCLMELGCDIIFLGDDVGTQLGMLISETSWRRHLKPRMQRICRHIKAWGGAKIAYHSCGSIVPIIPDLIEIGVDILNPVQPLAAGMDLAALKKAYGGRLCFYGAVDVQQCIPFGTTQQVREQVRQVIRTGGADGGFIAAPAHIVPFETSAENVLAYFEAVKQYGVYEV